MKQLLYLELPTPDTAAVCTWLQQLPTALAPASATVEPTPDGIRLTARSATLACFTWTVQNTTYLKLFQWSERLFPQQDRWIEQFSTALRQAFPYRPPQLPDLDLSQTDIFTALEPHYPLTAKYFRKIPNGEFDLQRVYWWEKRWRESVASGFAARVDVKTQPIVRSAPKVKQADSSWDVVVVGGALGALSAAMLARLGYKVALVERLKFGRMNREWNISRSELQALVDVGLLSAAEVESLILREYRDGFNLFFQGNVPERAKSPVLHTPTVLNIALDSDRLLQLCGEKLVAAGGQIFERTEFERGYVGQKSITLKLRNLETDEVQHLRARLMLDAMGTASPVAQQINAGRAFDSVCPTVGAVIEGGFEPGVWDSDYGDVLFSHGDISRGRQLIWELFPGKGDDLTFYLFHYHQIHPENPGSLLEMYEDFFQILPEYRRCDVEKLQWGKATFGYIPGRFTSNASDRRTGYDRVLAIGDAASLQSPLIFTGFGSLVRNLPRVTDLLHTALQYDLLSGEDLSRISTYQSNIAVTWLFSRGMMVPTGESLSPERVNAMLSTFFGILGEESPAVADAFVKDRAGWIPFTRMALRAARRNPALLVWIWEMVGWEGMLRWLPSYLAFTLGALQSFLFGWVPAIAPRLEAILLPRYPRLWHRLQAWSYLLTYGVGNPAMRFQLPPLAELVEAEREAEAPSSVGADSEGATVS
ncbi:FAD-dependent monooxygenase [Synechococcus sp. PCC 7336]|uniref:FAD-dependent monooxygenase n=1 Tax=Synechococcus sp. PCC 7336 TaxID=195250 RepID=UPI000376CB94|nr:FAD-dependent monooxygenase [Synechococcus sp. PCC 7336]